jgi:hypothetical protein
MWLWQHRPRSKMEQRGEQLTSHYPSSLRMQADFATLKNNCDCADFTSAAHLPEPDLLIRPDGQIPKSPGKSSISLALPPRMT